MSIINYVVGTLVDAVLFPFRHSSPSIGLTLMAALSAVIMLLIIRATSNQAGIAAVKRSIQACVYEIRLFGDDAFAIFRALGELLRHNLTYLRLSLVPLMWMVLPFSLLLIQLDGYYGVGALAPQQPVVVKVKMAQSTVATPQLVVPDGVRLDTPPVWIPSLREAAWRVTAGKPGDYELTIKSGNTVVTKQLTTTNSVIRRSAVRTDGTVNQFLHPGEPALPRNSGIESITVTYPSRRIDVFGWDVHWLIVFFVLSMLFGLALKSPLKVVL